MSRSRRKSLFSLTLLRDTCTIWRKLSAEKLMLLNYGVGEDS